MEKQVILNLSMDEALILFEYIIRLNKNLGDNLTIDASEQKVLRNLECMLEKEIPDLFSKNYQQNLNSVRKNY